MYRKLIVVLLCSCLLAGLSGCEYSKVGEAKDCVDKIYEYSIQIADVQNKLESATSSQHVALYKTQIETYQELIDGYMEDFNEICANLSEESLQKINDYIDKAASRELFELEIDY